MTEKHGIRDWGLERKEQGSEAETRVGEERGWDKQNKRPSMCSLSEREARLTPADDTPPQTVKGDVHIHVQGRA